MLPGVGQAGPTCLIVMAGLQSLSSSRMDRHTVPEGYTFGWKSGGSNLPVRWEGRGWARAQSTEGVWEPHSPALRTHGQMQLPMSRAWSSALTLTAQAPEQILEQTPGPHPPRLQRKPKPEMTPSQQRPLSLPSTQYITADCLDSSSPV